jgi:hypothetical protein
MVNNYYTSRCNNTLLFCVTWWAKHMKTSVTENTGSGIDWFPDFLNNYQWTAHFSLKTRQLVYTRIIKTNSNAAGVIFRSLETSHIS